MPILIREKYNDLIIQNRIIKKINKEKRRQLKQVVLEIENYDKAKNIIIEIAKKTQNKVKKRIEDLVTMVLNFVFEDEPCTFHLQFEQKRNQLEATPYVKIHGEKFNPKLEMGGGALDIISFAFRMVMWSISKEKTRPFFIFDEPFRFMGDLSDKAGKMLRFMSEELKLQIVIVSHDERLINFCDKVYKIRKINKKSQVSLIKEYKENTNKFTPI